MNRRNFLSILGLIALVAKVFPGLVKAKKPPAYRGSKIIMYYHGHPVRVEPPTSYIVGDRELMGRWKWIKGDACQDLTSKPKQT